MPNSLARHELDAPIEEHIRTDFASLRADARISQGLTDLRGRQLPNQIIYFYVVDADNRLVGVVPTRRLLMAPLEATVGEICIPKPVALPQWATVCDACEMFILHRFLALPVVDAQRRLIGVVDISVFTREMEVLSERDQARDVFQIIGVNLEQGKTASPAKAFLLRFPWLVSNIIGGVLCALLSGFYETVLTQTIILALFIPVVLALSESVSIQSVTITVQRLHGARGNLGLALLRESAVGLLLGLASGILVGLVALLWKQDTYAALVIWLGILSSMVFACLLGVLLPTLVNRLGRDPKVAAGPLVLACGDVACLLLYFNFANLLLSGRTAA